MEKTSVGIKSVNVTVTRTAVLVVNTATEPQAEEQSAETPAQVGQVEATSLHKLRCHLKVNVHVTDWRQFGFSVCPGRRQRQTWSISWH